MASNLEDRELSSDIIGSTSEKPQKTTSQQKKSTTNLSTFQRFCVKKNLDASNMKQFELEYLFPKGTIRYTNCETSIFKQVEGDGCKEVLENLLHEMEIPSLTYPADGEIDQMMECVPVSVRSQCAELAKCFTEIFDRVNFSDHTEQEASASCELLATELGKAIKSNQCRTLTDILIYNVLTGLQKFMRNICSEQEGSSISHIIYTAFWNSLIENVIFGNLEADSEYRLQLTKSGESKLQSTYYCDIKPQQMVPDSEEDQSSTGREFVMEKIITAIPDGICEMTSSIHGSYHSLSRRVFVMEIKTTRMSAKGKVCIGETPSGIGDMTSSDSFARSSTKRRRKMKTTGLKPQEHLSICETPAETSKSGTASGTSGTEKTKHKTKTSDTKLHGPSRREPIKTQHFLELLNSLRVTVGPDDFCYDIKPYAVGFYIVMNKVYVSVLKVKSDSQLLSDELCFRFINGRGTSDYYEMSKEKRSKRYFDMHVSDYFNLFDSSNFKALMKFIQLLVYSSIKSHPV